MEEPRTFSMWTVGQGGVLDDRAQGSWLIVIAGGEDLIGAGRIEALLDLTEVQQNLASLAFGMQHGMTAATTEKTCWTLCCKMRRVLILLAYSKWFEQLQRKFDSKPRSAICV